MPRQIVKIKRTKKAPYESAALFFAVLAYPDPNDWAEQYRFWISLCRWSISNLGIRGDIWAQKLIWMRPNILGISDALYSRALQRGTKLLYERFAAAQYILLPHLHALRSGRINRVKGFIPTVNNMTILVADALKWQEGGNSSSTVKSKVDHPNQ